MEKLDHVRVQRRDFSITVVSNRNPCLTEIYRPTDPPVLHSEFEQNIML